MDTTSVRCLINSISRFIHLVSCHTIKVVPIEEDYSNMVVVLKLLKPLLDDVVDCEIPSDEILYKECEELDILVNEARELMENWCPKMSKIHRVLQSVPFLIKMQSSSLHICHILYRLLQSSPSTSSITSVQHCMRGIKCLKQERLSENIGEALRSLKDDAIPCTDNLVKVIKSLNLVSNQEMLKETVAVEKERMNAQVNNEKGKLDQINQIVDLISHIRDYMLKIEHFEPTSGILIPPHFLCPLSLELMMDPVIVASGQTYDRASIQKWLDSGLTICPKTRQSLTHTNLIPNYMVKAMVASWCEENNLQLSNKTGHAKLVSISSPSNHISPQDLTRTDSFHCFANSSSSTSRSSLEVGNGLEKQKIDISSRFSGECNRCQSREIDKCDHQSPEQSYIHSRTESALSEISSIDYVPPASNDLSRRLKKCEMSELDEISSECLGTSPSTKESGFSSWKTGKQLQVSGTKVEEAVNGNHNYNRANSITFSGSGGDDLTTSSHVKKLVDNLKSLSNEVQTTAAAELRLLAKHNMDNRMIIGRCGAIAPLLSLLYSEVKLTQEHAVTALLNLSINEDNKAIIAESGAIEPLIHVLKSGNDGAKENSAAALFSLSVLEEYKARIGRSGAVKALVNLLCSGTLRGKKDAATALFNLSIFHENKARIVQAGAVKYLVELMDPDSGMVDKAVALLSNLSTIGEGRVAIVREGGIPLLVEVVESGSQRGRENAASVLLQLCLNNPKFCTLVLQEGAVPPLVGLSQSGTPRAKEKAQQLLSHFRNQREGATGKVKT
ncbi:U-box domain-containing protein 3-like [Durio zibethinus]|uniref:U-box domain-containing protein 12 n=1 Tax=Durio zibethinus TaxID=66656 RepID=A0A6P6A0V9_DURZI|nr:U-box domain-containing protein 3-like [Durio zibethinus]XP_022758422.1 U-box domain-containing protein 3-like [Durio zibethinus]